MLLESWDLDLILPPALDSKKDKYLALKVLTAHTTNVQKKQELHILLTIQQMKGRVHYELPLLWDRFPLESRHGVHHCFALSVHFSDVESLRLSCPTNSLSLHIVQKAIASVLKSLCILHSR
ncbi:hypothetical protein CPB84DRAFT_1220706 [Gymnopilus junonius]|uniref:Uncharacterized protein n=1 Tax=Gymnopilus junonius TaxID=109634 RepID=A0A9P5NZB9_GYMJU|nr:hypothetical protein CPB84DRAFT_1220706 [Gymnopilus junonius]